MSKNAWKRERIEIEGLIPAKWYPRSFLFKRLQTLLEYYQGIELELRNTAERLQFAEDQLASVKLSAEEHRLVEMEGEFSAAPSDHPDDLAEFEGDLQELMEYYERMG